MDSFVLRKVILPGDFYEFQSTDLKRFNGITVIEPQTDSPLAGSWPTPTISHVIQGIIRLQNDCDEPIQISKSQYLTLVRRMTTSKEISLPKEVLPDLKDSQPNISEVNNFFDAAVINPDGYISQSTVDNFKDLNRKHDDVFNPKFGAYNDASGLIRAKVNIGKAATS